MSRAGGLFILIIGIGVVAGAALPVRRRELLILGGAVATAAIVLFASRLAIGLHDGKPTLMLRLANARQNAVSGATAKLWLLMNEKTAEGRQFRRFRELRLERNETPLFALSWTVFHVIDEASPLWRADAQSLLAANAGLTLTVTGLDEQSLQELHARRNYVHGDVAWGAHYADILVIGSDGRIRLNFNRLDETEPDGAPTE